MTPRTLIDFVMTVCKEFRLLRNEKKTIVKQLKTIVNKEVIIQLVMFKKQKFMPNAERKVIKMTTMTFNLVGVRILNLVIY